MAIFFSFSNVVQHQRPPKSLGYIYHMHLVTLFELNYESKHPMGQLVNANDMLWGFEINCLDMTELIGSYSNFFFSREKVRFCFIKNILHEAFVLDANFLSWNALVDEFLVSTSKINCSRFFMFLLLH